jgi:hypothetical protein
MMTINTESQTDQYQSFYENLSQNQVIKIKKTKAPCKVPLAFQQVEEFSCIEKIDEEELNSQIKGTSIIDDTSFIPVLTSDREESDMENGTPFMFTHWWLHDIFVLERERRKSETLKKLGIVQLLRDRTLIPREIKSLLDSPPLIFAVLETLDKKTLNKDIKYYEDKKKRHFFCAASILKQRYKRARGNSVFYYGFIIQAGAPILSKIIRRNKKYNYWFLEEILKLERWRRADPLFKMTHLESLLRKKSLIPSTQRKNIAFPFLSKEWADIIFVDKKNLDPQKKFPKDLLLLNRKKRVLKKSRSEPPEGWEFYLKKNSKVASNRKSKKGSCLLKDKSKEDLFKKKRPKNKKIQELKGKGSPKRRSEALEGLDSYLKIKHEFNPKKKAQMKRFPLKNQGRESAFMELNPNTKKTLNSPRHITPPQVGLPSSNASFPHAGMEIYEAKKDNHAVKGKKKHKSLRLKEGGKKEKEEEELKSPREKIDKSPRKKLHKKKSNPEDELKASRKKRLPSPRKKKGED